jgi:hypothetical protein
VFLNADWDASSGGAQILNKPDINMTNDGNGGAAGSINAGSTFGGIAGTLNFGAGYNGIGGDITTSGGFNGRGGKIDTRGHQDGEGGSIDTSATNERIGGSITTKEGGGSINTTGTGSIQLGVSGTRTTVTGTATEDRAIALPDQSGIVPLISQFSAVDELTLSKLRVNGNDASGNQAPDIILRGATFFGSADGSLGIMPEANSAFGAPAAFFTGVNQSVSDYNSICLTAGYFPQLFLQRNSGYCGIQTAAPEATLDVNGNLILRDTANGTKATFITEDTLTLNRAYTLPDSSGVIALTSNTPFIINVTTSQGNVNAINYINGAGGLGFTSNSTARYRTMLHKCVVKKANIIVQQATAQTLTANNGSLTLMNITTGSEYAVIGGLTADNTNNFRNHSVTNLNIALESGDVYQFRLDWPTTIPTQIRILMDIYCYPV